MIRLLLQQQVGNKVCVVHVIDIEVSKVDGLTYRLCNSLLTKFLTVVLRKLAKPLQRLNFPKTKVKRV